MDDALDGTSLRHRHRSRSIRVWMKEWVNKRLDGRRYAENMQGVKAMMSYGDDEL